MRASVVEIVRRVNITEAFYHIFFFFFLQHLRAFWTIAKPKQKKNTFQEEKETMLTAQKKPVKGL